MSPDPVELSQAVLPEAVASEPRQKLTLPVEELGALGADRHMVRGIREQHLDHGRVAGRGKAKELADVVEHPLRGRLELVRVAQDSR